MVMPGFRKHAADSPLSSSTGATAAFPLPTPSIEPTPAPGKQGPKGLSPRQNTSRVNTGLAPAADAGASEQKSMAPRGAETLKVAGEELMSGKLAGRPMLQDLVKAAMVDSVARVRITEEAHLQSVKTAGEKCGECGLEKHSGSCAKAKSAGASGQHVEKLASALDYCAELLKEATNLAGSYGLTEHMQTPAPGVLEATSSKPLPDHKGQGVHTTPMHTGMESVGKTDPKNQVPTNASEPVHGEMMQTNYGKKSASVLDLVRQKLASEKEEREETEGMSEAEKGLNKARKAHEEEQIKKEGGARYAAGAAVNAVRGAVGKAVAGVPGAGKAIGDFAKNRVQNVKDVPGILKNRRIAQSAATELKQHGGDVPEFIRKGMESGLAEHQGKVRSGLKGLATLGTAGTAAGIGAHQALKKKDDSGKKVAFAITDKGHPKEMPKLSHSLADYMRAKVAEDAINPAKISAGPAVPPDTSAAGESGGAPVGGAPQGPTHLVGSADSAIGYTRGQAYANRKQDLGKYWSEPAMSAAHDNVLQVAFENTGKAGPKIASAPASSVKTAAARVLLTKLAESIDAKTSTDGM